jgi:hypothetical protein
LIKILNQLKLNDEKTYVVEVSCKLCQLLTTVAVAPHLPPLKLLPLFPPVSRVPLEPKQPIPESAAESAAFFNEFRSLIKKNVLKLTFSFIL